MFDNLTERLENSFRILKGQGRITEINIAETLKEVRRALLDADVNYKIAKNFTDKVKESAIGQKIINAVKPGQMMVKIVHDELARLMGGANEDINIKGNPAVILIAGLQGSGKTTFAGKLANQLKNKRGKTPLLVAGDIYRPAAIEQLKVLGEQIEAKQLDKIMALRRGGADADRIYTEGERNQGMDTGLEILNQYLDIMKRYATKDVLEIPAR